MTTNYKVYRPSKLPPQLDSHSTVVALVDGRLAPAGLGGKSARASVRSIDEFAPRVPSDLVDGRGVV